MRNHDLSARGFRIWSESWYSKNQRLNDAVDEIMIGFYPEGGGTTGEFAVSWIDLGGKRVPNLGVFDDAWSALAHFGDLLTAMANQDGKNVTVKQFAETLRGLGIRDMTTREAPERKQRSIRLSEIELIRGVWRVRGEYVSAEIGREAMRQALASDGQTL